MRATEERIAMNDAGNHPKYFQFLSELLLGGTQQASRTASTLESQDLAEILLQQGAGELLGPIG